MVVILYESFKNSHFLHREEENGDIKMTLAEEVTFFNKAAILLELDSLEAGSSIILDVRNTRFLDQDNVQVLAMQDGFWLGCVEEGSVRTLHWELFASLFNAR